MTNQNPLVSIIIPTFNRAHIIGETLDSVMAQTYQNWECIVVDDGSTDNTDEVMADYIAKDSRFQYHHRPKNRLPGGNAARNYGFEVSKGEYIQWFDSDDLMMPNKLSINVVEFLNMKVDVVFNLYTEFPRNNNINNFENYDSTLTLFENIVTKRVKINTPSAIWNKNFLVDKYLFDEEIFKGQELDFYSRLLFESKPRFKIIRETTSLIRKHGNGILVDFNKMKNLEMFKSFLVVRRRIHLMVNQNNNIHIIFPVLKFYENIILRLIKNGNYKLAFAEINFLWKNSPKVSVLIYKLRILKYITLINLLKLTKGKGFFKFKRILYIL